MADPGSNISLAVPPLPRRASTSIPQIAALLARIARGWMRWLRGQDADELVLMDERMRRDAGAAHPDVAALLRAREPMPRSARPWDHPLP